MRLRRKPKKTWLSLRSDSRRSCRSAVVLGAAVVTLIIGAGAGGGGNGRGGAILPPPALSVPFSAPFLVSRFSPTTTAPPPPPPAFIKLIKLLATLEFLRLLRLGPSDGAAVVTASLGGGILLKFILFLATPDLITFMFSIWQLIVTVPLFLTETPPPPAAAAVALVVAFKPWDGFAPLPPILAANVVEHPDLVEETGRFPLIKPSSPLMTTLSALLALLLLGM